jgi:hypothetical protein
MEEKKHRVTLEMSIEQAQLISDATELLTRIMMGQFDVIAEQISYIKGFDINKICDIRDELREIQSKSGIVNGIYHKEMSDRGTLAWDVHQVLRKTLAIHRNPKPEISLAMYDTPDQINDIPLITAKIETA